MVMDDMGSLLIVFKWLFCNWSPSEGSQFSKVLYFNLKALLSATIQTYSMLGDLDLSLKLSDWVKPLSRLCMNRWLCYICPFCNKSMISVGWGFLMHTNWMGIIIFWSSVLLFFGGWHSIPLLAILLWSIRSYARNVIFLLIFSLSRTVANLCSSESKNTKNVDFATGFFR